MDYAKFEQKLAEYRLIDDDFMSVFFDGQNEIMEFILKIILNKKLKVTETRTQIEINKFGKRSVRLDILAKDSNGKIYSIEIQRANKGAIAKRARFISAMLDSDLLEKGKDFSELPETYVIFFTENDVLKENLPVYNIERIITQTGKIFGDDSHIIYINGAYKNYDSEIGKLISDFLCRDPEKINNQEIAELTKFFKFGKGKTSMFKKVSSFYEDGLADGIEKGKAKGIAEGMAKGKAEGMAKGRAEGLAEGKAKAEQNFAIRMLKATAMSISEIASLANLAFEQVEELAKTIRRPQSVN